jgi:zinc protease
VKENEIFTSISSFVMGTIDPGLLVINGRVKNGVKLADAEGEVNKVVEQVILQGAEQEELTKVKNQAYSTLEFGEVEVMNRAMNLAFAKLSGDASIVNQEAKEIESVSLSDIQRVARQVLREDNSSVMYYHAKN